ncbi:haloacid dehalogenase type II [Novispirillum itersonii]|uniref:haloacid dehalogenase type II n=1 Tax=Novispirillum itersonii TaxID=189 RepID=UPI00037D73FC|nr:haloacid dehalogenase type II [Novispirillum itersonii]
MNDARIEVCVFDAYGTLFDVHSAVRRAGSALGSRAGAISALWRSKQLEYTWVRSLMHRYADFWSCTEEALDHALTVYGGADPTIRNALLNAYRTLDAYADVRPALERLRDRGKRLAVLSNGTPEMLKQAVEAAGLADFGMLLLSVDGLRVFKPDPRVYALAGDALGISPQAISFQSANAWDVAGATAAGLHGVWINRIGAAPEYGGATKMLPSLAGLPELVR